MKEIPRESQPPDPGVWVDEFAPPLFRYAMSQVGDPCVAEDLVQETFLAALRTYRSFSGRSSFLTWLLSILRRKVVDYRRSSAANAHFSSIKEAEGGFDRDFDQHNRWLKTLGKWPATPSEELEKEEFWQVFEQCVEKLPPLLVEVFRLREMLSLKIDEVCEIVGISRGNLAVRLHRARMALRGCLEDRWFDG